MNGPVTHEMLVSYAAGELDAAAAAVVEGTIRSSPELAATVSRLTATLRTLRTDADGPSRELIARAAALRAAASQGPLASLVEGLRTALAALVHDSRATPALAGFRSVQEAVDLAYSSEAADVEMRCEPVVAGGVEKWRVVGQVTLHGRPQGACGLWFTPDADTDSAEATVGRDGMFTIELGSGRYDLVIMMGDVATVIPDLEL